MKRFFSSLFLLIYGTYIQAYQLSSQEIMTYNCGKVCGKLSHVPLHKEWLLSSNHSFAHQPLLSQKSKSYRIRVTSSELKEGITFNTTAASAIFRISPIHHKSLPQLKILTQSGQSYSLEDASELYSRDETIYEPRINPNQQSIVQLKPQLGMGTFLLVGNKNDLPDDEEYLLSVYDKYSNVYLEVETDKQNYLFNDVITATISLKDITHYPVEKVSAEIVDHLGNRIPLKLEKAGNNKYQAKALLQSRDNPHGANWYVEAQVKAWMGDKVITRQGHTAFSFAIPSAKINRIDKISSDPLSFNVNIDVATSSRYALEAVLFYKDGDNKISPLSFSQKAKWLTKGSNDIKFHLIKNPSLNISEDQLYVGYLHLIDYGQLKTVYHADKPIKLSELG